MKSSYDFAFSLALGTLLLTSSSLFGSETDERIESAARHRSSAH